ncbi:DUF6221 family protein [Micromonospora sp. LOL_014]|uniref:DUF6221 family protein n=1 Tax=Micromonospora sp. LOL_014 TaxID=3345415 RepID=UPI003A8C53A2
MSDLIAWLREQLDEDERVAREASTASAEWREGSSWLADLRDPLPSQRRALRPGAKLLSDADARHIARHDPARVLAEVEARRAIIDEHEMWARYQDDDHERAVTAAAGRHPHARPAVRRQARMARGVAAVSELADNDEIRRTTLAALSEAHAVVTLKCWMCGVEPTGLAEVTSFGDLAGGRRVVVSTGWPDGDHDHEVIPPSPGELAERGDRAARRILAIAAE